MTRPTVGVDILRHAQTKVCKWTRTDSTHACLHAIAWELFPAGLSPLPQSSGMEKAMSLPALFFDPDACREVILEQDAVLEMLAEHLELMALHLRSYGLDYIAEQIERVG